MARRQRGELPTPGGEQYAATDQQCAGARLNDGRKCSINFAWGFGVQAEEVRPESARRRLYVPRFAFESRRIWITEPGNGGWRRDQLMQQLQPLRYFRFSLKAHAGYIAARPAEVGHEAGCNWIAAADEHDRYGRGGSHCRARGDILATNHGHLPASQIGRKCWEPIDLILRPAEFDSDVMAVDEPRFLQAVAECRYSVNCVGSSCCLKESDEHLGGGEVDDEIELGRLLDRDVGRLRSSQNLVDNLGGALPSVYPVRSIGHQTARFDVLSGIVNGRQPRAHG